jgi:acyl-CoA synthetase (AMP-forming)/AMP-acid ligase II
VDGVEWYPRDVEEALCEVDGIAQAALIGVPDARHGQRPLAFITLHAPGATGWNGHDIEGYRLKAAIAGKVAHDLDPLVVRIVDELPMTPTGKISKAELAARWSAGH